MEKIERLTQAIKHKLSRDRTTTYKELSKDRATTGECEANGNEKEPHTSAKSIRWELCRAITLGLVLSLYIIIGGIGYESITLPARIEHYEDTKLKNKEFLDALAVLLAQDDGNVSIGAAVEDSMATVLSLMRRLCTRSTVSQQPIQIWTIDGAFLLVTSVITTIGYPELYPSTADGQYALMVFALFGIPLSTLFLMATGRLLKQMVQWGCFQSGKGPGSRAIAFLTSFFVFVLGISTFVLVPSLILSQVENWAYKDAFYFTFMTLTTIGTVDSVPGWAPQGDLVDSSEVSYGFYRLFISLWIFTGLAYVSLLIQSVLGCEKRLSHCLRKQCNRGLVWMRQHRSAKKQKQDTSTKKDQEQNEQESGKT